VFQRESGAGKSGSGGCAWLPVSLKQRLLWCICCWTLNPGPLLLENVAPVHKKLPALPLSRASVLLQMLSWQPQQPLPVHVYCPPQHRHRVPPTATASPLAHVLPPTPPPAVHNAWCHHSPPPITSTQHHPGLIVTSSSALHRTTPHPHASTRPSHLTLSAPMRHSLMHRAAATRHACSHQQQSTKHSKPRGSFPSHTNTTSPPLDLIKSSRAFRAACLAANTTAQDSDNAKHYCSVSLGRVTPAHVACHCLS
jgi:hypothetical protein